MSNGEQNESMQVTLLTEAGLLDPDTLTADQRELVDQLNEEEVRALISVADKVGYHGTLQEIKGFIIL